MIDEPMTTDYDSIAERYIEHTERPDSWNNLYERPFMITRFPELKDKNVLDLGCGSGFYTGYALEKGARVTAVDLSKAMIDRLSQRIHSDKLRLECADISKPLSFLGATSYDYVICSLVIHYIKDWTPLLNELYRILKKNGRVFISTHHPFLVLQYPLLKNTNYFETVLVEDIWSKQANPFKVHYYTRSLSSVLQPIIKSKFQIVSIEEPLPDEKCKQLAPQLFQRLCKEPGFLFFILKK